MIEQKIELLAPAGNIMALEAALNAGADAIYLGLERFSARQGAKNFTIKELEYSVNKAHLLGKKIYVAFNTLISDGELYEALEIIVDAYNIGIDSIILQDWGLFYLIKQLLPNLPIHASTQMNTHNTHMVHFLERQGAKRVTLARELTLSEIANICNSSSVEIETFIHGALCFSYSGQCLFSSMVGNRSGNRGLCPQACRLSYKLGLPKNKPKDKNETLSIEELSTPGTRLLSTKDLCGINLIPQLIKAGVKALKIEGRMKSPEYVAIVVDAYRRAIDRYLSNPDEFNIENDDINDLKEVFSRGFTEGYLANIKDNRLMSFERPSDRGLFIGRVSYIDVYKALIGIELRHDLCVDDEIEIWVSKGGRIRSRIDEIIIDGKKVECAKEGLKAHVKVKEKRHKVRAGDRVFRVENKRLMNKAKGIINGDQKTKIPIKLSVNIEADRPIELKISTLENPQIEVRLKSDFTAEKGINRVLTEQDVIMQMSRLGNTVYTIESWDIKLDNISMVPLGKLNELRRIAIAKLDDKRLKQYLKPKISFKEIQPRFDDLLKKNNAKNKIKHDLTAIAKTCSITVDVMTYEQANNAVKAGADWIYYRQPFKRLKSNSKNNSNDNFKIMKTLKDASDVKIGFAIGNIVHESEINGIISEIEYNSDLIDAIVIDNFGLFEYMKYFDKPIFLDYHTNIFNSLSADYFIEKDASQICLSPELAIDQIKNITSNIYCDFEILVHGWLEVMISEHCIPSASKESCKLCEEQYFIVKDDKGFSFPVEQDNNCRSHLFNSRQLCLLPNISEMLETGVKSLRLLLYRYAEEAVYKTTRAYKKALDMLKTGRIDFDSIQNELSKIQVYGNLAEDSYINNQFTTGHFYRKLK